MKKYKLSFWNRLSLRVYWVPRMWLLSLFGILSLLMIPGVFVWALIDPKVCSETMSNLTVWSNALVDRWKKEIEADLNRLAKKEPTP